VCVKYVWFPVELEGMLTVFRRHRRRCPHATKGRDWRRCSCPLSVEGTLPDGVALRKALNTANWELASEMVRVMETGGASTAIQVSEAVESSSQTQPPAT
jgi:hypothetical protein